MWAWDYNNFGQLGDGTYISRSTPVQVAGLEGVATVVAGYGHSIAVKNDGTVWAWGYNNFRQLGDGTTVNRSMPVQVAGLEGVVSVAAGYWHSIAVKNDGTVWAWGDNSYRQLGDGTYISRSTPVQVARLEEVVSVAAGGYYSIAVKNDGTLWTWGDNRYGQLGDGRMLQTSTPIMVQSQFNILSAQIDTVSYESIQASWTCNGDPESTTYTLAVFDNSDNYIKQNEWTTNLSDTITDLDTSTTYKLKIMAKDIYNRIIDWYEIGSATTLTEPITIWTTKCNMLTPRYGLGVIESNNKIYIIGGFTNITYTNATEEYDPLTNQWIAKASMPTPRYGLGVAVVNNKVYAIGGYSDSGRLNTVEEYDPATNTWTTKASMPTERYTLGIAALNNEIYVIGGSIASGSTNIVENYNPDIDQWKTILNMPTSRYHLGATAVDNKIYAIGGFSSIAGLLSTVEELGSYYASEGLNNMIGDIEQSAIEEATTNDSTHYSETIYDISKYDITAPTILSAALSSDNAYIDIIFDEGVYGMNDGTTVLTPDKLALRVIQKNNSSASVTISSIKKNDNNDQVSATPLTGGETTIRVFLNIVETSDRLEAMEIIPADGGSIYDITGNAMSNSQTTGTITFSKFKTKINKSTNNKE